MAFEHKRDSNPRHSDLREGTLTTELQWSESNVSYKATSITRHLLLGFSILGDPGAVSRGETK